MEGQAHVACRLVKVTLSAVLDHVFIAVKVTPSIYRAFIWAGSNQVSRGRCLVAWPKVTRHLDMMGYALRMHWEWLSRTDTNRVWALLPSEPEKLVQAMFHASVTIIVGDGAKTLFWSDRWIDGCSFAQLAPDLVEAVCKQVRKARLARERGPKPGDVDS
jgi:hypothetical protein